MQLSVHRRIPLRRVCPVCLDVLETVVTWTVAPGMDSGGSVGELWACNWRDRSSGCTLIRMLENALQVQILCFLHIVKCRIRVLVPRWVRSMGLVAGRMIGTGLVKGQLPRLVRAKRSVGKWCVEADLGEVVFWDWFGHRATQSRRQPCSSRPPPPAGVRCTATVRVC